jgi:hypothetical protein
MSTANGADRLVDSYDANDPVDAMRTASALSPEQRLVHAIIGLAIKDARSSCQARRDSARRFLDGSAMLIFWCDVAGLNTAEVIKLAAAATEQDGESETAIPDYAARLDRAS